ncbi:SPOR domain-containing protein [Vibrio sp.]|uniref:SPOR domain-containing protein n=1 Tax=Vibrio sp. TaxID=678 RepID=UPI003D11A1CA
MKKTAIVGISTLLAACSTSTYVTDVSSESYREEYKVAQVETAAIAPVGSSEAIKESDVEVKPAVSEAVAVQPVKAQKVESKPAQVAITPPSNKQKAKRARFGYTIQVVAVGSQNKVDQFANQLPKDGQPVWENYKVVNGTKWYTVLYGDYATTKEAKMALSALPAQLQDLKPFIKSIDGIKNSDYPTLNKLN